MNAQTFMLQPAGKEGQGGQILRLSGLGGISSRPRRQKELYRGGCRAIRTVRKGNLPVTVPIVVKHAALTAHEWSCPIGQCSARDHFGNSRNSLRILSSVFPVLPFFFRASSLTSTKGQFRKKCLPTIVNRASTLRGRRSHTAVWPC